MTHWTQAGKKLEISSLKWRNTPQSSKERGKEEDGNKNRAQMEQNVQSD
jgi:hypothetical protein